LTNHLSPTLESAWIGLSDLSNRDTFTWVDNSELDYTNWFNEMLPTDNDEFDGVVLQNDGLWMAEFSLATRQYIVEIPDFNLVINGDFLPNNADTFGLGTTTQIYIFVDSCGYVNSCSFDVIVQEELADYCNSEGQILDTNHWIQQAVLKNTTFNFGNNDGYDDYTSSPIEFDAGDLFFYTFTPNITVQPTFHFWRAWIDWNADGDFYDAGELIFETKAMGAVGHIFSLPNTLPTMTTRMRVSMSLTSFPEPCGDLEVGEVEDYQLNIEASPTIINGGGGVPLVAFPNPTDGKVTLKLQGRNYENALVVISNSLGREVRRTQILDKNATQLTLSMEKLIDDVYWVTILSEGKPQTIKIILNRFGELRKT
jgi:hypothetical protein